MDQSWSFLIFLCDCVLLPLLLGAKISWKSFLHCFFSVPSLYSRSSQVACFPWCFHPFPLPRVLSQAFCTLSVYHIAWWQPGWNPDPMETNGTFSPMQRFHAEICPSEVHHWTRTSVCSSSWNGHARFDLFVVFRVNSNLEQILS